MGGGSGAVVGTRVVRVGPGEAVGCGEVVVDYSLRLRGESRTPLWVFGYTNDVMAYIPSERVLKEGRYEGETSMIPYGRPGPWTPGLEEKIVSTAHALLARTLNP